MHVECIQTSLELYILSVKAQNFASFAACILCQLINVMKKAADGSWQKEETSVYIVQSCSVGEPGARRCDRMQHTKDIHLSTFIEKWD